MNSTAWYWAAHRDAVAAWAREHVTMDAFTVMPETVEEVAP